MPIVQPDPGSLHVDTALTDLSVRFSQDRSMFVATSVFPQYPSKFKSDKFYVFDRSYFQRTDATLRGPGAEAAQTGYEVSTDSYSCDVFAIKTAIPDQTRANADPAINLEANATELVTQHLLQKIEQDWVTTFFAGSLWGTTVTGASNFTTWDDAASTPIEDIRTGVTTVAKATAYKPNTLVLGPEVFQKLLDHPDILERIKYTTGGFTSEQIMARLFGVDRLFVAWSVKNSSAEGVTASYTFNLGKHALLVYTPATAGLGQPAAGYTFTWNGLLGAGATGIRIKRYREEKNAADMIEGEIAYDQKLVSSELGYFFSGAVA
jgi:hypothetical protein